MMLRARLSVAIACLFLLGDCGLAPTRAAARMGPGSPASSKAQDGADPSAVVKVSSELPAFRAVDQFGQERDFDNLKGPNGLVILFFRSADW